MREMGVSCVMVNSSACLAISPPILLDTAPHFSERELHLPQSPVGLSGQDPDQSVRLCLDHTKRLAWLLPNGSLLFLENPGPSFLVFLKPQS